MQQYLIRLDDASDHLNLENWLRIETILTQHGVKPIFGIIPDNQDPELTSKFPVCEKFWNLAKKWISMGWVPALHGCSHELHDSSGGLNPINNYSEFVGLSYEVQAAKIRRGVEILQQHGINADIFFAPAHSFDENTLSALRENSDIRIISDMIANNIFKHDDFYFIPQQSGMVRLLPFRCVTFCLHPNNMNDDMFSRLERFLENHYDRFSGFDKSVLLDRPLSLFDKAIRESYFLFRKLKQLARKSVNF